MLKEMLRYHVAYHLPRESDRMVVAEVLDFPGVASQGFDLADARTMIASALEDTAQLHLEEGKALPAPNPDATAANADLIVAYYASEQSREAPSSRSRPAAMS
jgi:predicted RNase H-like HicB family nuclease